MKNSTVIALTFDFWTSLKFLNLWNSYNVAELYKQFPAEWDITKKNMALVTDNVWNMVLAVNQSGFVHV